MRLKFILSIFFVLSIHVAVSGFTPPVLAAEDGIIAVVDDDVITGKDLKEYMRGIYSQLRIEGRSDNEIREVMAEYQSKGINQLIEDRLILAEANRQMVQIRPNAIEERLNEIKKRYPDPQEFLVEINKEGVTISEIRKKIEDQLKAHYVVTKDIRDKIYVNPQEVTEYYNAHIDEYRRRPRIFLQSISVKSDVNQEKALTKIKAALDKVSAGEDFAAVAKEYSELPNIGEIPEESLSPELKAKTDMMWVGQVSDIIPMADAFYILKLSGRTSGVEPSLSEVKEEIYQKLFEVKFKVQFSAWIEKLHKKSYVEIKK